MASRSSSSGLKLQVETRAPLSVQVSRQLRQAIVSGEIGVGVELPSEKELTRDLGVGRSTVREALRILQAQGLLSGGETVSTRRPRISSESALSQAAAHAMENVVRLGRVPIEDLVALRVVLEGEAVKEAARSGERIEAAHAALDSMREAGDDVERFRAADLDFHRALARASGNAAFPLIMDVLRTAIRAHLGDALLRDPDRLRTMATLLKEHAAILQAVERREGELAQKRITRHIRAFYTKKDKAG